MPSDGTGGEGLVMRGFERLSGHRTGLLVTACLAVAATAAALLNAHDPSRVGSAGSDRPAPHGAGARPAQLALTAYDSCIGLLDGLRAHAAAAVTEYGLPGHRPYFDAARAEAATGGAKAPSAQAQPDPSADHSGTNVQEKGVDEPDVVKTDGSRIVSVAGGVLRVVDVNTRKITGRLDLTMYAGATAAQVLLSGDHALVTLDGQDYGYRIDYQTPVPAETRTTYLLVELSGTPRVTETFRPSGSHLDARMVGSTVRLVVSNRPRIEFPYTGTPRQRLERNRAAVRDAPLSAWLPSYDVTIDGRTTTATVPCRQVRHPADYTGASLLTVYTLDLGRGLGNPQPVSVAADGDTVYATPDSLYVASNPDWYLPDTRRPKPTELHRFDIRTPGAPHYLGSGTVPGRLLNQYSLSDHDGYLRIAVTTAFDGKSASESAVYVLDADTLTTVGHVDGLGKGERIYAVRFLGDLGYVVTFRQVDPLYVIDLRHPARPRVAGELKITGYSDYLHPVGDGRLLGVGQAATAAGSTTGLQASLFDVSAPNAPRKLAGVVRPGAWSGVGADPHGFLYWPADGLAVIPMTSWQEPGSSSALVLRVTDNGLDAIGRIRPDGASDPWNYVAGVERTLVIGDHLWTLFGSGIRVSRSDTLASAAWIPFS